MNDIIPMNRELPENSKELNPITDMEWFVEKRDNELERLIKQIKSYKESDDDFLVIRSMYSKLHSVLRVQAQLAKLEDAVAVYNATKKLNENG